MNDPKATDFLVKEVPEGARFAESLLIRMLRDETQRSWADVMNIIYALDKLRRQSKLLRNESNRQNRFDGESSDRSSESGRGA